MLKRYVATSCTIIMKKVLFLEENLNHNESLTYLKITYLKKTKTNRMQHNFKSIAVSRNQ